MKKILIFSLLTICAISQGQNISFTEFPAKLQLFPRNDKDSATVTISGKVINNTVDSVILKAYRNNSLTSITAGKITFGQNPTVPFFFSCRIYADTVLYKFEVYSHTNSGYTLLKSADSVVCGDMFLVNGQSNAMAAAGDPKLKDTYLRSFGTNTDWNKYDIADTTWGLARSTTYNPYGVGAWEFQMMKMIKDSFGIPVGMINGAANGSWMSAHLRNDLKPADTAAKNIYGKLLYRARKAKVDGKIKAIFWHQGEANTGITETSGQYLLNFKKVYNAWKLDYPLLAQVFMFQVNLGCTSDPSQGYDASKLREIQRIIPDSIPAVRIMSTLGISGHDGCHYTSAGYQQMGRWMYRLVARDYYKQSYSFEVTPPNIKKAYFTSDSRDQLAIITRNNQELTWPVPVKINNVLYNMQDYLFLDGKSVAISEIKINKDTLFVSMLNSSNAQTLSYLPNVYYTGTTTTYEGPYIMGTNGISMLSFNNVPITCNGNNYPVLPAKTIQIKKLTPAGTSVDTVKGTDPDGNKLFYFITAGNQGNVFTLDSATGILQIKNPPTSVLYYLTIKVRDNATCSLYSSNTYTINCVTNGLDEASKEDLKVSPNPSDGNFEISLLSADQGSISIILMDLNGAEILNIKDEKHQSEYSKQLQVKASSGIYFMKVVCNGHVITRKIILY